MCLLFSSYVDISFSFFFFSWVSVSFSRFMFSVDGLRPEEGFKGVRVSRSIVS